MRILPILIGIAFFCCISIAAADEPAIGFVKDVNGASFIERNKLRMPVKVKDRLIEKDILITGLGGSMVIILQDNSTISVGSNTRLVLSKFLFEPADKKSSFIAQVKKGTVVYFAGLIAKLNQNGVKFETGNAVCGIRGSHAAVKVEPRGWINQWIEEMDLIFFPIFQTSE